jgi:hypothetical protein
MTYSPEASKEHAMDEAGSKDDPASIDRIARANRRPVMFKQTSTFVRLLAIFVIGFSLVTVLAQSAAAKREPPPVPTAQQVRELVLKHREDVLARIAAIMSGKKDAGQYAQVEPAPEDGAATEASEPEETEAEAAEPEGDEAEGEESTAEEAEGAAGESEEGEGADEEVTELPETGIGSPHGIDSAGAVLMAILGLLGGIAVGLRRMLP